MHTRKGLLNPLQTSAIDFDTWRCCLDCANNEYNFLSLVSVHRRRWMRIEE
jgi:hypothetical protein